MEQIKNEVIDNILKILEERKQKNECEQNNIQIKGLEATLRENE